MTVLSTIAFIPLANYPTGTFTSPEINVPDAATDVQLDLAACTTQTPTIWQNATTLLTMRLEFSVDGGPFVEDGGFTDAGGGIHTNRFGQEIGIGSFKTNLPEGISRKARVTFQIQNGPLRTQGSAVWLAP